MSSDHSKSRNSYKHITSPRSVSNSRPTSAQSNQTTNSKNSWISVSKTRKAIKEHSIDKTLKKIDQIFEKDLSFIQQLENKPHERRQQKRQAAELLNKRWNDQVYTPTQQSIQRQMDKNGNKYSQKLQEQYALYLNHNNLSDGNVFLDVFKEEANHTKARESATIAELNGIDYQPPRCKEIQNEILKPKKVHIVDPLKKQLKSNYAKEVEAESQKYNDACTSVESSKSIINQGSSKFWSKLRKESSHIESPESQRRRIRIRIEDQNRRSQITWSSGDIAIGR